MSKLLTVRNLVVEVPVRNIKIIDDISFSLEAGQTLGLVGESGCGKSMTCYAVADMLPRGIARTSGSIVFERDAARSRKAADPTIAMIFQDPTSSLNPLHTIGHYLESALYRHQGLRATTHGSRPCGFWNVSVSIARRAGCAPIHTSSRVG